MPMQHPELSPPITNILARFVVNHPVDKWPEIVTHEAHRTILNWLGCTIGAVNSPAVLSALSAIQLLDNSKQALVLGTRHKLDVSNAAFVNGLSSHVFDYDDTHLQTIIHPAGPIASAVFSLAEHLGHSGSAIVDSIIIGIDVSCRLGNMVYPDHYDRGWHITGTTGSIGAAAACSRLLKLSEHETTMALGIAASQPVGLREQFGSMTKPLHPGAAAKVGLLAALLASKGFTASPRSLEAPRGWGPVISNKTDWREITDSLGNKFEIINNSYKPYACGVVIHPSLDACVEFRGAGYAPSDIIAVTIRVHPLVLELTSKKHPSTGLEAKFSIYTSCAIALTFGRAGQAEYEEDIIRRADIIALSERITAIPDPDIDEDSAQMRVSLVDEKDKEIFIKHATGSLDRPMSDEMLENKFFRLVEPVLGARKATSLISQMWNFSACTSLHALLRTATPETH